MPKKKEKKEKIVYIDDNSTIADMSGTRKKGEQAPKQKSTFREKMQTYFAVVKKMLVPMFCTLAAFAIIYLLLLMITGRLW